MSEICEERENSRSHLVPKYCGCIRPLPIQSSCISPITLYLQASKCPWILSLETITQKVWQRGQNLVKLFNPAMTGKKKPQTNKTTKTKQQKTGHYGSYSESPTAKSQTSPVISKIHG